MASQTHFGIVHLSDLHYNSKLTNLILESNNFGEAIAMAVVAECRKSAIRAVHIIVTGDATFRAHEDEFKKVGSLLQAIKACIARELAGATVAVAVVAGNHDCDFDTNPQAVSARASLLRDNALEFTSYSYAILAAPQETFRNFRKAVECHLEEVCNDQGVRVCQTRIGDTNVAYLFLESATTSHKTEQPGTLRFPVEQVALSASDDSIIHADIAVAALHHPLGWFEPNLRRRLSAALESAADLVLTGHEHVGDDAMVTRSRGNSTIYVEGLAVQEHGSSRTSGFKFLKVDVATREVQVTEFSLHKHTYEPSEVVVFRFNRAGRNSQDAFRLRPAALAQLNDAGLPLEQTGPDRRAPTLEDVFVYPYVREVHVRANTTSSPPRISSDELLEMLEPCLVQGPSLSGKTALARRLFLEFYFNHRSVPVLMDAIEFSSTEQADWAHRVNTAYLRLYDGALAPYAQLERSRRILLVDDLHRSQMRGDRLDRFLEWATANFNHIVLFADPLGIGGDVAIAQAVSQARLRRFEIIPFTMDKTRQLVTRWCQWCGAGSDTDQIRDRAARAFERTRKLMAKVVDHVPFYILGILQQIQAGVDFDENLASQGAVFEALATLRLQQVFRGQLDFAKVYLAALANEVNSGRSLTMSRVRFEDFHREFCEERAIENLSARQMEQDLKSAQVLWVDGDELGFRHRFGYYLFLADHIASNVSRDHGRNKVIEMFNSLVHQESALVLVFLVPKVKMHADLLVGQLIEALGRAYEDVKPAELGEDARELGTRISQLPIPALELDPDKRNKEADEVRASVQGEPAFIRPATGDLQREFDAEQQFPEIVRKALVAINTILLAGQILRSYSGTLNKMQKTAIARATYDAAFRMIGWQNDFVVSNWIEITTELEELLAKQRRKDHSDKPKPVKPNQDRIEKLVRGILGELISLFALSAVKIAADATGIRQLDPVVREVLGGDRTALEELLALCRDLDLSADPPLARLREVHARLRKNPLAIAFLQRLAAGYLYSRAVSQRRSLEVCNAVGLEPTQVSKLVADSGTKKA